MADSQVQAAEIRAAGYSRYSDSYIIDQRFGLRDRLQTWRNRIDITDRWARGDWQFTRPDGSKVTLPPKVQNIMHDAPKDIKRLAAESLPTLRALTVGDDQPALDNALLRTAIAQSYWLADNGELSVPQLVLDLVYTDTCFLQSYVDRSISDYPLHRILNPRQCLPNFLDNRLLDLYYVETMKARVAMDLWPDLKMVVAPERTDDVEVTTVFGIERTVKCVYFVNSSGQPSTATNTMGRDDYGRFAGKVTSPGRGYIVSDEANPPELVKRKQPMVSWARIPTFDRVLRGELDQLPGILEAIQMIVQMILDGSARAVWPMAVEFDILNTQDQGPGAILHAETAEGKLDYVAPPSIAPEIFSTLAQLKRDSRSTASHPEQREGIDPHSQGSSSELMASQGKLTSLVREYLRYINYLRQQQSMIDMALDEAFLDERKPLIMSIGNIKTYKPSQAIKGNYRVHVTNGMMAGLDIVQTHSLITQDFASGLIGEEFALEQMPYVPDPKSIIVQRDKGALKKIQLQQLLQPQFAMALFDIQDGMDAGEDFSTAFRRAQMRMQQAQDQMQQGQGTLPGQPGPAPGQVPAAVQNLALQKGGIPGQAPALPSGGGIQLQEQLQQPFAPPPSAQVRIR